MGLGEQWEGWHADSRGWVVQIGQRQADKGIGPESYIEKETQRQTSRQRGKEIQTDRDLMHSIAKKGLPMIYDLLRDTY